MKYSNHTPNLLNYLKIVSLVTNRTVYRSVTQSKVTTVVVIYLKEIGFVIF